MLVHICCSVDSHYFLQKLQEEYPDEKLIGFFYDPNIHPYSEYRLRFSDVEYSCKKLDIELIEGEYDFNGWLEAVRGLENEPEKGERCRVCFDDRLEISVKKAKELNQNSFTTTLLISPKKSQQRLDEIGKRLSAEYSIDWVFKDYRTGQGMQIQAQRVKQNSLYRQNYCGCLFGLRDQREQQGKLMDEMFSPVGNQILPESIEERIALYEKRNLFEEEGKEYKIVKNRFLNYRLLNAKVTYKAETIPSYFLAYSTIQNAQAAGRVEYSFNEVNYLNRNEIKLISLEYFNKISKSNYKNVKEIIFDPLEFAKEVELRQKITNEAFDLSAIIVLDSIDTDSKYLFSCRSEIYEDVKEVIILH